MPEHDQLLDDDELLAEFDDMEFVIAPRPALTVIPTGTLLDARLSLSARGLLAFVLAQPDGWRYRDGRRLAAEMRAGRDAVFAALGELENAGYFRRGRARDPVTGRWRRARSVFFERPPSNAQSAYPQVAPRPDFQDVVPPAETPYTKAYPQVAPRPDFQDVVPPAETPYTTALPLVSPRPENQVPDFKIENSQPAYPQVAPRPGNPDVVSPVIPGLEPPIKRNLSSKELRNDQGKEQDQKTWSSAARLTVFEPEDEPEPLPPASPAGRPRATAAEDPGFAAFWDLYPRKVAKGAARRAWVKILKAGVDPALVIKGAERYRDEPRRRRSKIEYTAHPATWLNAERWNDEPDQDPIYRNDRPWWEN